MCGAGVVGSVGVGWCVAGLSLVGAELATQVRVLASAAGGVAVQPTPGLATSVPAMIVASTGDTRTVYSNAQALHGLMTSSRLVTLAGARIHAVYPWYGDNCVNGTVNAYLAAGKLPPIDLTCQPSTTSQIGNLL